MTRQCMNECGEEADDFSFFCGHDCAMQWAERHAPVKRLVVLPEMKV